MGEFRGARPLQEVRLRNWPAGRVGAMKLMISRLEDALNETLGAQVQQDLTRVVSDQVPFIINFEVNAGYRLFKVNFPTPPGLVNLLFYEIQHDSDSAFTDPITLRTPMNNILISGVGLGETRYFRARVVNTSYEASFWTDTIGVTSARAKIDVIDATGDTDVVVRVKDNLPIWTDVFDFDFTPSGGGAISVQTQVGIAPVVGVDRFTGTGTPRREAEAVAWYKEFGPAHAQFRWLFNNKPVRWPRTMVSQRPFNAPCVGFCFGQLGPWGVVDQGTMWTPFFRTDDAFNLKLQVTLNIGNEWQGGLKTLSPETYMRPEGPFKIEPIALARNVRILEVQEEF